MIYNAGVSNKEIAGSTSFNLESRARIDSEYSRVADPLLSSAQKLLPEIMTIKEYQVRSGFIIAVKHSKDSPIFTTQLGKINKAEHYNIEKDLVGSVLSEEHTELQSLSNYQKSIIMRLGNVIVGLNGYEKSSNSALLMSIALNAGLVGYDESIQKMHNMGNSEASALYTKYIERFFPKKESLLPIN